MGKILNPNKKEGIRCEKYLVSFLEQRRSLTNV